MKTRIISAIVALCYFALVLALVNVAPIVLVLSVCALSALAIWEILKETKLVNNKIIIFGCCLYAFIFPLIQGNYIKININLFKLVFVLFLIIVSLAMHSKTTPKELAVSFSFTLMLSFAFSCLMLLVINYKSRYGLLYLLLACCFAWGSDTGAYFTGVFFGKHKLAPVISPKKTIEGAIGGVVFCTALTVLIGYIYNSNNVLQINIYKLIIIAPVFSVIGIIGDLFASYIKRSCNIKDYGKIMPGHGGVLDRFDSLLLISPAFLIVENIFPLFKI